MDLAEGRRLLTVWLAESGAFSMQDVSYDQRAYGVAYDEWVSWLIANGPALLLLAERAERYQAALEVLADKSAYRNGAAIKLPAWAIASTALKGVK